MWAQVHGSGGSQCVSIPRSVIVRVKTLSRCRSALLPPAHKTLVPVLMDTP
jgi:hypothetical protein